MNAIFVSSIDPAITYPVEVIRPVISSDDAEPVGGFLVRRKDAPGAPLFYARWAEICLIAHRSTREEQE